jgi:hypothetical protein
VRRAALRARARRRGIENKGESGGLGLLKKEGGSERTDVGLRARERGMARTDPGPGGAGSRAGSLAHGRPVAGRPGCSMGLTDGGRVAPRGGWSRRSARRRGHMHSRHLAVAASALLLPGGWTGTLGWTVGALYFAGSLDWLVRTIILIGYLGETPAGVPGREGRVG